MLCKEPVPILKLTRTGCEDGAVVAAGVHPIARIASQSDVQLLVASPVENCPPEPVAQSNGPVIDRLPSFSTRSGT